MRERVLGLLIVAACGELPREDGPSPFGEAESATDPADDGSSTSTGDLTTGLPPDDSSPFTTGASDPMTTAHGSETSTGMRTGTGTESGSGALGSSEGSSSSTGFDTTNDGTLEVQVSVQTTWETGECDDVTVTNISAEVVVWEIELDLPGTIDMAWNTTWSQMGDVGTFAGVDFNASLDPGAAAMFGFCVDY